MRLTRRHRKRNTKRNTKRHNKRNNKRNTRRHSKQNTRRHSKRRMMGGNTTSDNTDTESVASIVGFTQEEQNELLGLGFEEGEIDIMEGLGIPIETIKREYRNALISTGENGYGLIELSETEFEDIINANELNELTNTDATKNDIANLVIRAIQPTDLMEIEGGRKRIRRQRKYRH